MLKKVLIGIAVILVLIQFIRPEKNIHPEVQANAIQTVYSVPDTVNQLLTVACYDCHSNNTRYPWYNNIQPLAWWLNNHVQDGRKHLNFDEFTSYSLKKQDHKLEELIDSQKDHWMPLDSYTWAHGNAVLTAKESKMIVDWANSTRNMIQANPEFSLKPAK
ncbi:MAG: heme-binding domain-containing protein [Pelobium sp.]